jgi:hypothetical protein
VGQGTGWIFIPESDTGGSRVMPPFAGFGSWPSDGGPLLTLQGTPIHIFILPTGTRPGAVLQQGETFRFAGHIMPTLDSKVTYTVTAPGGSEFFGGGQANSIGYFYDFEDDFVVNEPGLWSVDVSVWHDGQIGTGEEVDCATLPVPCPSGDVLGSDSGRYWFYVVPPLADRLNVSTPVPGFLDFEWEVTPVVITGSLPVLTAVEVDYTISMAGYILKHGQATIDGSTYEVIFDPASLAEDFPNLDLVGRDSHARTGLADTFAISMLMRGQRGEEMIYRANTITIQGDQVFVNSGDFDVVYRIYLPMAMQGG